MEIVVSGIRSTGNLHLGNYFGAVKNFVRMQYENKCYFFIADFHSLTTHPAPENLFENTKQVLVEYLAAGLDPEVSAIYLQSDIREIPELYLLLSMNAYLGELERCTSFKEKVRSQPENINAGLLSYPVLMAADIVIHKATRVPVGKDQEQHLEMTRTFAKRFNRIYNVDFFPEPVAYNFGEQLIKIPGLDGSGKMGKSEGNGINLSDTPGVIKKKVMRAVTDNGPTIQSQEMPEPVKNLFTILTAVSSSETVKFFLEKYNSCTIKYGDLKNQLAEDIISFTLPIRQKINELYSDNEYLTKIIKTGAEKARESASKTLGEVRKIMGFKSF